jgi:hypothetical protein
MTDVVGDDTMLRKVVKTFLFGVEQLDKEQQHSFEQRIGFAFIKRGIWPTAKYFISIRNGHA